MIGLAEIGAVAAGTAVAAAVTRWLERSDWQGGITVARPQRLTRAQKRAGQRLTAQDRALESDTEWVARNRAAIRVALTRRLRRAATR